MDCTSFLQTVKSLQDFLPIIVAFASVIAGALIFVQAGPRMQLRIIGKWVASDLIIIRLEIENQSRIRMKRTAALLQILEYPILPHRSISEWVPLVKNHPNTPPEETPPYWHDPTPVLTSTKYLYPGETIFVERIHKLEHPEHYIKVAFQFRSKSLVRALTTGIIKRSESWTATALYFPAGDTK